MDASATHFGKWSGHAAAIDHIIETRIDDNGTRGGGGGGGGGAVRMKCRKDNTVFRMIDSLNMTAIRQQSLSVPYCRDKMLSLWRCMLPATSRNPSVPCSAP